jgi:hypothetical protein
MNLRYAIDESDLQAGDGSRLQTPVAGESGVDAIALPPQSKFVAGGRRFCREMSGPWV